VKRVLLTGGTGFVGASLTRRLLRDGHEVHLLLRPGHATWRLDDVRDHVRTHVLDATDRSAVDALVAEVRPEWVFHLMAYGAYSQQRDAIEMARTNVTATMTLMESCASRGFEAFVHAGSSSEYGLADHAPREDEALAPNSAYAVTKAAATHFGQYMARSRDLHIVTLRLYAVFGPWEEPTRLVPNLLTHALRGELPDLVDPRIARDFVYVDDVDDAFVRAATQSAQGRGAVYNVGSGTQCTLGDLVEVVRRLFEVEQEPRWGSMPNRAWDTAIWVSDSSLAAARIGWQSRTSLEAGLTATAEWIRASADRLDRYASPAKSSTRPRD
jgi:nucleoside-diphosphate-sugar epimerase